MWISSEPIYTTIICLFGPAIPVRLYSPSPKKQKFDLQCDCMSCNCQKYEFSNHLDLKTDFFNITIRSTYHVTHNFVRLSSNHLAC